MNASDAELNSHILNSALYEGVVWHRRYGDKPNEFTYNVFMVYLDLQELDQVFARSRFWSHQGPAMARLKRSDYIGDSDETIYHSVCDYIRQQTGQQYCGRVRLLTNLRYFGYCINPISNYYCFDAQGEKLLYVIAAVTNTPWKRTHYYLHQVQSENDDLNINFNKQHHVSPFMAMDMIYQWQSNAPAEKLSVSIQNYQQQKKIFEASLSLHRKPMTSRNMRKVLVRFPLMTVKVGMAIYWQALKLWLKGVRFHPYPTNQIDSQ